LQNFVLMSPHSLVIAHFLARKHSTIGANDVEAAQIDTHMSTVIDKYCFNDFIGNSLVTLLVYIYIYIYLIESSICSCVCV